MSIKNNNELTNQNISYLPNELESEVREGLEKVGVEHVSLIILSEGKDIVFESLESISNRISISRRISESIEIYLDAATCHEKNILHFTYDNVLENRIFDHKKLSIITNKLSQYSVFSQLNYDHRMVAIFHSVESLSEPQTKHLQLVADIMTAWSNSWVAHNTMLRYWKKYSEPKNIDITSTLTKSEFNVLELLIKGFTGPEISSIRNVSKETVRTQIKSILHKTHCHSQNQLISRFSQSQWTINCHYRGVYS
ncbi:helix-turn-helix transcriptional regulator [Vibrio splendidus]|uniref:helix-turn-helix transcriptional regulator n=1 Tax=Vibrio splendidus TaxID=29497 RepID=UPI000975ED4C|nr:helix-turn-helix transcriptional regulator [Vibrio splendidus]OMO19611.1 DNA-binding protein [Vibrio splendidus]PMG28975.1 DNA-binding protein [Vibrio splendidus]|tara:strand:+ start:8806 stop:9564 length:759 start_codon:yes stop_codon:yes gene_type:complete